MMPTDQEIVELYQELGTQSKVARKAGCSRSFVGGALRRSGIHVGRGGKHRKIHDYYVVFELWNEHHDAGVIADRLDIARGYVLQILWKRFAIRVPRNHPNKYDLPMDDLARRYRDGETCGEIGRSLGLSGERIRRRLMSHGVKIRSAAESVPRGKKNIFYKDGRGSTYRENKYQSRKAAAAYLGRQLPVGWVVHHQDENPRNLDLENLYLFPSLSTHSAYHTRLLSRQRRGLEVDAIQLVLENGGLPLLQHPLRVQCEPGTDQPDP